MEPKNIVEITSAPDLVSERYSPSLGSVVLSTFPHQAMACLLLISVISFTTCAYFCKSPHLDCELVVDVILAQSMAWRLAYSDHV